MNTYMHTIFRLAASLLVATFFLVGAAPMVRAATPYLQVITSDNTNFQVTVTGADSYRMVDFYTRQSDTQMWTTFSNVGTTDSSGYFNTTLNVSSYNPSLTRESYVIVNGQQSSSVFTGSGSIGSNITFSQNNVSLAVGQNTTITIYGGNGSYYMSNNSNTNAVSASISGNTLTLYGNASGSSNLSICSNYAYPYYSSNCGTLYVTVTGSTIGNVWFSPSNPTMYVGQSLAVSINSSSTGYAYPSYSNAYYVSSNSNPNAVSASISGTVLNLYASTSGSASITVTHSSLGWSGTLSVTVMGSGNNTITFSNTNPSVQVGKSTSVAVYAPSSYYSNNFYVSSNSNANVVTTSMSGQTLTLYGLTNGSSTVTVCQYNASGCGSLYVTVTGSVYGTSVYANGQLLNQNGTIYIVYKNTITGFSNASAFLGLGFSFANALTIDYTNLQTSGYIVTTPYAAHPWGSWVKSGQTVYFVHQDGLIPISSYDIFLNNSGQNKFIVEMNSYDWQRTMLSHMTYGDYRLR